MGNNQCDNSAADCNPLVAWRSAPYNHADQPGFIRLKLHFVRVRWLSAASLDAVNMRLWSLHPKYLDPQGLVALWREALLAQAVLRGETRGYRNHPQLDRFKNHSAPLAAISLYLKGIHEEAKARDYTFDISKIKPAGKVVSLTVTTGQMAYEWAHLLAKLEMRNPALYRKWRNVEVPEAHSIFTVCAGDVESWERY